MFQKKPNPSGYAISQSGNLMFDEKMGAKLADCHNNYYLNHISQNIGKSIYFPLFRETGSVNRLLAAINYAGIKLAASLAGLLVPPVLFIQKNIYRSSPLRSRREWLKGCPWQKEFVILCF